MFGLSSRNVRYPIYQDTNLLQLCPLLDFFHCDIFFSMSPHGIFFILLQLHNFLPRSVHVVFLFTVITIFWIIFWRGDLQFLGCSFFVGVFWVVLMFRVVLIFGITFIFWVILIFLAVFILICANSPLESYSSHT